MTTVGERFIGWRIPKDKQPGWIIPEEYRKRWECIQGKSVDELPRVVNENDIDVFIHDSLHTTTNMIFEFFITYHSMEDDGVILSDDTSKSEAFEIFCTEIDVSDCRKFQNDLGYIKK
ncbi:class I SAM-dependent methyltransferase [Salinirubellus sp. GCM10025899]|uniref:class I SAM-dependent methyltransferase n=1 Tax=Salinirubellus sp. GCM10025899 TaxID=3252689 RepID=UPI00361E00DF